MGIHIMMGWTFSGILMYFVIAFVLRFAFGFDWWVNIPVAIVVYLGAKALNGQQGNQKKGTSVFSAASSDEASRHGDGIYLMEAADNPFGARGEYAASQSCWSIYSDLRVRGKPSQYYLSSVTFASGYSRRFRLAPG